MFDDITPESLRASIIEKVPSLDTREGSFISDMIMPVCVELWKCYQAMAALIPIAFVDENSGGYIDLRCEEYGITRKPGRKASTVLQVIGAVGAVIPAGTTFVTPGGLGYTLESDMLLEDGSGSGIVAAVEPGSAYNVPAGNITAAVDAVSGLFSVTNDTPATGGADEESDAALVSRLYTRLQSPATSGNANHYRQWAIEVPGVGDAQVLPLWSGAGTVKVIVADTSLRPPDMPVVDAARAHIVDNAPIGADITVVGAEALVINLSAAITINGSTKRETVKELLEVSLEEYLRSLAFRGTTVSYSRVMYLLMGIDGVTDCQSLMLNGETANVPIKAEQVPIVGMVTIA